MENFKRFIFVKTKKEGFHKYPDAPDEVSFLRNYHRHLFGIKVKVEVNHNERELEFIMVKRDLEEYLALSIGTDSNNSCEAIAERTYYYLKGRYPGGRHIEVVVDEDGENGGIITDIH